MNFQGHLKIGFAGSVLLSFAYGVHVSGYQLPLTASPEEIALIFGTCLAGSLSPDLDVHSTPSRLVAFILSIFCALSLYHREPYPALIASSIFIFIKAFPHRSYIHTYSLAVAVAVCGVILNMWLMMAFAIGMCIHYKVGDSMPIFKKSNWVKPFKSLL